MAILTTIIVGLLVGTISKVAADEVKAWLPSLSRWLLAVAVSRLPESEMERYREEWEADLLTYPGEIFRCFRAIGMYRASRKIRRYARKGLKTVLLEKLFWLLFRVYVWVFLVLLKRWTKQVLRHKEEMALGAGKQAEEHSAPRRPVC